MYLRVRMNVVCLKFIFDFTQKRIMCIYMKAHLAHIVLRDLTEKQHCHRYIGDVIYGGITFSYISTMGRII